MSPTWRGWLALDNSARSQVGEDLPIMALIDAMQAIDTEGVEPLLIRLMPLHAFAPMSLLSHPIRAFPAKRTAQVTTTLVPRVVE